MAYASSQDMIDRFGEGEVIALSDRGGTDGVDEAVLGPALDEATAEIEGYLAGRYALPLQGVPRLVAGLACDIARYRLSGADVLETEAVRNRYRDAVRLLEQIAAGKVALGLAPLGEPAAVAAGVSVQPGQRSFPQGAPEDW